MTEKSKSKAVRKKKTPKYQSFRLSGRIAPAKIKKLPKVSELWRDTFAFLWLHRRKMLLFVFVYTVTYLIFAKGIGNFSSEPEELKKELDGVLAGNIESIVGLVAIYASMLGSLTTVVDDVANFMQVSIVIIFSLAFIWLIRRLHSDPRKVTVKDAFYRGMRPLIPFIIVLVILVFELIPAGAGSLAYLAASASASGFSEIELLGLSVVAILGVILSLYLITGSIFALYIVTLKNMTPLKSIKASMRLLSIHRWVILRKVLSMIFLVLLLGFVVALPFILWIPRYAEAGFFILACCSFAMLHTYLYKLYRSML